MNIIKTFLLSIFVAAGLLFATSDNDIHVKPLQPEPQHQRVVQKVAQILTQLHYKDMSIDDTLASQFFNNYIEYLDYNKSYFTASDIKEFEQFRYNFDTYLITGDLSAAYYIFNIFQERMSSRLDFILKRTDQPFDFTIDEYYKPDRDSVNWAKNVAELDDFWRKRIKNEYLSLKISGKEEDKIDEILKKRYTNLKRRLSQNQSEDVVQIYLNALSNVFDPHTSYFSPKSSDDFKIQMQQSLEGIGARLSTDNEYTKVVEIIPGGPADKSGLIKENEYIIAVGQDVEGEMVDVIGWRIDDVVQLIRGPKNSKVRLDILHNENDLLTNAETIIITRDQVKLEDSQAKSDTIHIKNNGKTYTIGIITVPAFYWDYESQRKGDVNYKSTTRDVEAILEKFEKQNVDGVVIDLRRNGGGYLEEAISLTGLFIENGPVVQVRDMQGRLEIKQDNDPKIKYAGPLAVLVDQFSASASEIFAAAIQDYDRGIVLGNQTFGKGTVQNIWDLNRLFPSSSKKYGQIKLTVAKYYRINGGSTQHVGVIPDIELPSQFEHDEIGESSQKNALQWDQISAASYKNQSDNLDKILPSLKTNHQSRMVSNADFTYYTNELEKYKELRHNRVYSLNEAVRRKEKEDNKNTKSPKKDEDIPLKESANILSDYIQMLGKK